MYTVIKKNKQKQRDCKCASKTDNTEGEAAFDDLELEANTLNFDNGGGSDKRISVYVKKVYGVTNIVYDKFARSKAHNARVLKLVCRHVFDTSTSNSVLNVIASARERYKHIMLSRIALKRTGTRTAYFKVFAGNRSGVRTTFQNNVSVEAYVKEVEDVFCGAHIVVYPCLNLITATYTS